MKCKEMQENLSAYLDNELSEIEIKLVDKHLKKCLECSRSVSSLKKAVNILQAMPALNVSEKFTENLLKKINTQDTKILFFPKNINKKILSYVVAAACLLLVIKITFFQTDNLQLSKISSEKQKKSALRTESNYRKNQNTLPLKENIAKVQQQPNQLSEKNLNTTSVIGSNNKKPQQQVSIATKDIAIEKFKTVTPAPKNESIKSKNIETEKSNSQINEPSSDIALSTIKKQNDEQVKEFDSKDLDKNTSEEKKSTDITGNIGDNTKEGNKAKIISKQTDKVKSVIKPAIYNQYEIINVNLYVNDIKTAKQFLKKLNFKKTNKSIYEKEIFADNVDNDIENLKKQGDVEIVSNTNKDKKTDGYKTKQAEEIPGVSGTDDAKKSKGEESLKGISGGVGTPTTSGTTSGTSTEAQTKNQKNKKLIIKIYLLKGAKK